MGSTIAITPTMAITMNIQAVLERYRNDIANELRAFIEGKARLAQRDYLQPFYGQMRYHLGWTHADLTPANGHPGKLLRPTLLLLAYEVTCSPSHRRARLDPPQLQRVLPAAIAIELVHNFSLIHDDIEDGDEERRHRPTLWKVYGEAQAINTGDGMFSLARLALWDLPARGVPLETTLDLAQILDHTCVTLCEGQYLDISFEGRDDVSVEMYLDMIAKKTASLMRCGAEMGARLATTDRNTIQAFARFGEILGLAFQVRDDLLGVWGRQEQTGKLPAGDVRRKKRSLPLLYALEYSTPSARQILRTIYASSRTPAAPAEITTVLEIFQDTGTQQRCLAMLTDLCRQARTALTALPAAHHPCPAWNDLATIIDFVEDVQFT
jgi:geranylgeranyl diphosphate synthase type I